MLICTTWKARPLTPEQTNRMMAVWGQLEAEQDAHPESSRLCWYLYADGSGGMTVSEVKDEAAAHAWALEQALSLGEFLELDSRVVYDQETALPVIGAAVERMNG